MLIHSMYYKKYHKYKFKYRYIVLYTNANTTAKSYHRSVVWNSKVQLINSRVLHLMHPCFFSQGPRFIALICLYPRSCEITLGHWTLKLDIGHWNWILKLDIGHWNWTLKLDIHYWNWTFSYDSQSFLNQKWCSFELIDYCWTTTKTSNLIVIYLFCDLLICEGWIYWYNLSPLRGGEIGQHVIIFLHYPP